MAFFAAVEKAASGGLGMRLDINLVKKYIYMHVHACTNQELISGHLVTAKGSQVARNVVTFFKVVSIAFFCQKWVEFRSMNGAKSYL